MAEVEEWQNEENKGVVGRGREHGAEIKAAN